MDPISISIGAFSALSGLAEVYGNFLTQKKAYKNAKKAWAAEAQERKEDYIYQQAELNQRMAEIQTSSAAEELERKLELQREAARVQVASGEAGITGNLSERLMVNVYQASGRDKSTIQYNRDAAIGQAIRQGIVLERRARAPKLIRNKPDVGMALARSGLAIGGGYLDYKVASRKK